MSRLLTLLSLPTYTDKVRSQAPVGYWPLAETAGSTATDESGNGRNGSYTGVDLGQSGIGDGRTAPLWDGSNDYCNVYSAGLSGAISPTLGTFAIWARVSGSGVWTDGVTRLVCNVWNNATNRVIYVYKPAANNQLVLRHIAGGTSSLVTATSQTSTGWLHLATTWDKASNEFKGYLNGTQVSTTQTLTGTFSGSVGLALLGADQAVPTNVWSGYLAHAAIWDRVLPAATIASLARLG